MMRNEIIRQMMELERENMDLKEQGSGFARFWKPRKKKSRRKRIKRWRLLGKEGGEYYADCRGMRDL